MNINNLFLLTISLLSTMPLVLFAETKLPESSVKVHFKINSTNANSYASANGFKVIDAGSYYQAMMPTATLQPSLVKTKTMKLRDKIKKNMNDIDTKETKSVLALKKWNDFVPKIKRIIKKEKELDELLDYMSRLKKVSTQRKDAPGRFRNTVNGESHQTPSISCSKQMTAYSWPRKCI